MESLSSRLQGRIGRDGALEIAAYCNEKQARFDELVEHMLSPDEAVARQAAWAYQLAAGKRPEWAATHVSAFVERLGRPGHPAILRGILRSMEGMPIPPDQQMPLMEICFAFVDNPKVPVAVRVFAMTVLEGLVLPYPELCRELCLIIESHMPESSAGFKSRGRRILKNLNKRR